MVDGRTAPVVMDARYSWPHDLTTSVVPTDYVAVPVASGAAARGAGRRPGGLTSGVDT
jgi:hypothetical protein